MQYIETLEPVQIEALERAAYYGGDYERAELLGLVAELKREVEALEEKIEDTVTLEDWEKKNGSADEYKTFFFECFLMLNGHYPAPSVTSDYDKGVIFDAIRLGEETREQTEAKG
jgi:hypothetical protein